MDNEAERGFLTRWLLRYAHLLHQTKLLTWRFYIMESDTSISKICNKQESIRQFHKFPIVGFKHIFWSIIVCVAMGCAAIFLYSNTIDFMNATVVTTVDTMTVPLSEVFFPSVVVCNINQVNFLFSAFIKWNSIYHLSLPWMKLCPH